jgi:hypothetical protein
MLTGKALRDSLERIPPIKVTGVYWRVVTASSLLGLVMGHKGQPRVTRLNPQLLFAGGPGRGGALYAARWARHSLSCIERTRGKCRMGIRTKSVITKRTASS